MKQMKTQHTPGPWHIEQQGIDGNTGRFFFVIQDESGREIVDQRTHVLGRNFFELESNARAISAVPELIQACQAIIDWTETPGFHGGNPWMMKHVKLARIALAKATAS